MDVTGSVLLNGWLSHDGLWCSNENELFELTQTSHHHFALNSEDDIMSCTK